MRTGSPVFLVVVLVLNSAGATLGRVDSTGSGRSEAKPLDDPLAERSDLEEVHEALQELSAAGVPATREEVSRFLDEADQARRLGTGRTFPLHGSLRLRWGNHQGEGSDRYGKLHLDTPWLRVRARFREHRSGWREESATLEADLGPCELRVGELGSAHGHGLLAAAPGRGAALTADKGLAPPRERFVTWLGAPDPRSLTGCGVALSLDPWHFRFLSGRQRATSTLNDRQVDVATVGLDLGQGMLSLAGLRDDLGRGASLTGRWRSKGLSGSGETLAWCPGPGIPPTGAAVMTVKWMPVRGSGLEGGFGLSDLVSTPGLAARPAMLPGWTGRGFALRVFTRNDSGLDLWGLLHQGVHLDLAGTRSRAGKSLMDLQARKRWTGLFDLGMRLRQARYESWTWSIRYPWQPPRSERPRRRTVLSVWMVSERERWKVRLLIRTFGQDQEGLEGRRSLMGLSGDRLVGRNLKIRGTWVTAWGAPVDLVSAVVPLTGMVLPRHWGRWRSETILGLEWRSRAIRLQAAASLRYPDLDNVAARPVATLWLQSEVRW